MNLSNWIIYQMSLNDINQAGYRIGSFFSEIFSFSSLSTTFLLYYFFFSSFQTASEKNFYPLYIYLKQTYYISFETISLIWRLFGKESPGSFFVSVFFLILPYYTTFSHFAAICLIIILLSIQFFTDKIFFELRLQLFFRFIGYFLVLLINVDIQIIVFYAEIFVKLPSIQLVLFLYGLLLIIYLILKLVKRPNLSFPFSLVIKNCGKWITFFIITYAPVIEDLYNINQLHSNTFALVLYCLILSFSYMLI